jgi:hypothetical protein
MDNNIRASRFLEQTLLWNFLIHLAAMGTMGLIVLHGIPGGTAAGVSGRVAFVAEHPWLWRIGWLPWHLCAFIDLVTGIALVSTRWVPKLPAVLTLLVTIAAVAFEQTGEIPWSSVGVGLAQEAVRSGDLAPYLAFERWAFQYTVVYGASLYMVMALGWTWCFAAAGTWNRTLTWLSIPTWGLLSIGSFGLLLPDAWQPSPAVVGVSNGLGFVLLEIWLWLVCEEVFGRSRPAGPHGRYAAWRHPAAGPLGWLATKIGGSHTLRAFGAWAPPVAFRSDISDVLYVNYLVDADKLTAYVPDGFELQRLGPGGRYSLFTFLTYNHGHFGPALLGPLRGLLPSPVQSNWRTYVRDPRTGKEGIYFTTNAISNTLNALAARHLAEGMPMHVPAQALVKGEADGSFVLRLVSGIGSAPDVEASLRPGPRALPGPPWTECFPDWQAFIAYCVPQDRAFSAQPWHGRATRQEIQLGIPLEVCHPLCGEVTSKAAEAIVGPAAAVCFHVPTVHFRFDREEYDWV